MQLFLIEPPKNSASIVITGSWILHQMSRVLRMKISDEVSLQWENNWQISRWLYTIVLLSKKSIKLELVWELEVRECFAFWVSTTLAIALPNKRSKAELIIQKLSEIGISKIIWFSAQRSQYTSIPEKKVERMNEISKEATEQSWWWKKTEIEFVSDLKGVCEKGGDLVVCDILEVSQAVATRWSDELETTSKTILIWPEWGRWPQDYEVLKQYKYSLMDLGERVLRMETAAIIAAWRGMNM